MNERIVFEKAQGEGSRGGKIIGHTRSGKPIYSATANRHAGLQSHPNGAGRHVRDQNPEYNAEDHADAASAHQKAAKNIDAHPRDLGRRGDIAFGRYARHLDSAKAHQEASRYLTDKKVGQIKIKTSSAQPVVSSSKKNSLKNSMQDVGDMSKGKLPLGAAFSHARKVAKKNGGGRKKERDVANRYLRSKGHQTIGKSMTSPTFAQYAQALAAQAQSPAQPDDHWGMQQYQRLFQLNRDNVAALRQQALMLQMGQSR